MSENNVYRLASKYSSHLHVFEFVQSFVETMLTDVKTFNRNAH